MFKLTTVPVRTYLSPSKIPGARYAINPYVGCPHRCLYCYAAYMRKFTAHRENWGDFLDVKLCEAPLPADKLFHQHVLLSSVTDPYNPFEQKFEITRKILRQLVQCQAYVSVLTKSALITRDIDLFLQLPQVEVGMSFSTVDESVRKQLEPATSSIQEKIHALQALHAAGLQTAVMAAPLLPGISNWKEIIDKLSPFTKIFRFDSLNMRSTFAHKLMDFLDVHYPNLLPLYQQIYQGDGTAYWKNLAQEIETYGQAQGLQVEIFFGHKHADVFETPISNTSEEPSLF